MFDTSFTGHTTLLPSTRSVLDAELEAVLLSKAAQFGLPAEWVSRLDLLDPERRQVLRVRSCVAQSPAAQVLRSGDMLLAVSGRPVTCFQDVERLISETAAAAAANGAGPGAAALSEGRSTAGQGDADASGRGRAREEGEGEGPASKRARVEEAGEEEGSAAAAPAAPSIHLTIYRAGAVLDVEVVLGREDGMGTGRLVHWCGAQLQAPHRGVRELGFLPEGAAGVYISRWHHGSPAHRYGLYALHWIQQVNGVDTPDLDS